MYTQSICVLMHMYVNMWFSQEAVLVKNLLFNTGDTRGTGSIPGLGRFPGGGHGNLLQHSCLENPKDRGAWWATTHRVTKSQTQLKLLNMHTCKYVCLHKHRYKKRRMYCTWAGRNGKKIRDRWTDKTITTLNVSSDSEGLLTPAI